jgi:hypothetical protein
MNKKEAKCAQPRKHTVVTVKAEGNVGSSCGVIEVIWEYMNDRSRLELGTSRQRYYQRDPRQINSLSASLRLCMSRTRKRIISSKLESSGSKQSPINPPGFSVQAGGRVCHVFLPRCCFCGGFLSFCCATFLLVRLHFTRSLIRYCPSCTSGPSTASSAFQTLLESRPKAIAAWRWPCRHLIVSRRKISIPYRVKGHTGKNPERAFVCRHRSGRELYRANLTVIVC